MSKTVRVVSIMCILLVFILSACNLPSKAQQTEEPNAVFTQAALTVQAQLGESTPFAPPTLPPAQPTNTAIIFPTTAPATATLPPAASATPVCEQAHFIKDVTIPDGSLIAPGTTFKKTWRLKNTGNCTWSGYILVFDRGDSMNPVVDAIPTVAPNQEVDVSVTFTTPSEFKSYKSYWRIRTPSGVLIPVFNGVDNQSFFVDIKVGVESSGYDFYTQAPSALWISGAGNLTFGGPDSDANGFAMYKDGQKVEGGSSPAKVLETHPQFVNDGVISGRFPAYTVVSGEHFTAQIGFLTFPDGSCGAGNAKFQLNYRESGVNTTLGTWTETCDGTLKAVDVNLTPLAGKNVEFILAIIANGPSTQDWAVWIRPQIAIP